MVWLSRLRFFKKMKIDVPLLLFVSDVVTSLLLLDELSGSYSLISKCDLFLCVTDTPLSLYVTVPSSDCMALSDW